MLWLRRLDFPPFSYRVNFMDQSAISYFEQKFGTYDGEQLGDLVARRADLSEEAVEVLDRILAARGLKDSDVFIAPADAR